MTNPDQTLAPQFKAILQRFTKSARVDEIVAELMAAVNRTAPKIEIPIAIEPCNHMTRLMPKPGGGKHLVCKHCSKVFPISK